MNIEYEYVKNFGPSLAILRSGHTDIEETGEVGQHTKLGTIIKMQPITVCTSRSNTSCKACVAAGHADKNGCEVPIK